MSEGGARFEAGKESEVTRERQRVEKIRSIIEQPEENDPKPKIHFSNFGLTELQEFEKNLEKTKDTEESIILAVVRCFDKDSAAIEGFNHRIKKMKENLPGLSGVFMSINKERESGETEKSLVENVKDAGVPVVPMQIENYTWTAGLNSGAALMNELCLEKKVSPDRVRVLNMSFDVEVSDEELRHVNKLLNEDARFIFTVRASKKIFQRADADANEQFEKLTRAFKNPNQTDVSSLPDLGRNTFSIISLNDIISLGGFNPNCNGQDIPTPDSKSSRFIDGMEDHEFWSRLILQSLKEKKPSVLRGLKKSFQEPVRYTDKAFDSLPDIKQRVKTYREIAATANIVERNAAQGLEDNVVPKGMQDFVLRK